MKYPFLILIFSFFLNIANSQELPLKKDIIAVMKTVNNYWISQNPVPGNNQWARAAYFTGNVDFYKIYPKKSYLDYTVLWANNNNWSLNGGNSTRNADNQTCGQVYLDLYLMDAEKINSKISAIKANIDNMVNSPKSDDWWWVDALYMSMPVFARLGKIMDNPGYFDKMYQLYTNTKVTRKLYNTTENLWYRDESYDPPYLTPNGEDSYWARGNGWAIAAHVKVLQQLPENDINRNEYIETFRAMAAALKLRQQNDGFWYPSLDDPKDYGGTETSGTSFFTYSLAWGINNHLLDSASYYPVVVRAWNALVSTSVQKSGLLGYVQGVGSAPSSSQPVTATSTADFGVGAFLLAGSEVVKLAKGDMPLPSNLNIKSVAALSKNKILVSFNSPLNNETSLISENYLIDKSVVVNKVDAGMNDSSVYLNVSDIQPGTYIIEVKGLKSVTGEITEDGEKKSFIYTGIAAITASSYEPGTSNTPEKTMDFDLNTRWSANGSGQWIMYDLGEQKMVQSVEIAFYNGATRLTYFSVALSDDADNFTEMFNGASGGKTVEPELFDFDDTKARYVKITGFGNSQSTWNSITETRINFSNLSSSVMLYKDNSVTDFYPQPLKGRNLYINQYFNQNTIWKITGLSGLEIESGYLMSGSKELILKNDLNPGVYIITFINEKIQSGLLLAE